MGSLYSCSVCMWPIALSLPNNVILGIIIVMYTDNQCKYNRTSIYTRAIVCIPAPNCLLLFIVGAYGVVLKCRHKAST